MSVVREVILKHHDKLNDVDPQAWHADVLGPHQRPRRPKAERASAWELSKAHNAGHQLRTRSRWCRIIGKLARAVSDSFKAEAKVRSSVSHSGFATGPPVASPAARFSNEKLHNAGSPVASRCRRPALVASVADAKAFRSGRDFSAWVGLVPKQNSSGCKDKLSSRGSAPRRRAGFARGRKLPQARD